MTLSPDVVASFSSVFCVWGADSACGIAFVVVVIGCGPSFRLPATGADPSSAVVRLAVLPAWS